MKRVIVVLLFLLAGCDAANEKVVSHGEWKKLGYVTDGNKGTSLWKRTDPDTGDVIYVTTAGGVTVVRPK